MSMDANSVRNEFFNNLSNLTDYKKSLIVELMVFSEKHIEFAEIIVDIIKNNLRKNNNNNKLVVFYLIDAIVKKIGKEYKDLFEKEIVQLFYDVFVLVNKQTRCKMYQLRKSWGKTFSKIVLYNLDCKIQTFDRKWPTMPEILENQKVITNTKTSMVDTRLALVAEKLENIRQLTMKSKSFDKQTQSQAQKQKVLKPLVEFKSLVTKTSDQYELKLKSKENVEKFKDIVPCNNKPIRGRDFPIDKMSESVKSQKQNNVQKKLPIESNYDNSNNEHVKMDNSINNLWPLLEALNSQQLELFTKLDNTDDMKKLLWEANMKKIMSKREEERHVRTELNEFVSDLVDKLMKNLITVDEMSKNLQEYVKNKKGKQLEKIRKKNEDSDLESIKNNECTTFDNSRDINNKKTNSNVAINENNNNVFNDNSNKNGKFSKDKIISENIEKRISDDLINDSSMRLQSNYRFYQIRRINLFNSQYIPSINQALIDKIQKDETKIIYINKIPCLMRFYDKTAIVFLNWDDPREIKFINDSRIVTFNRQYSYMLMFNKYYEIMINNNMHKVCISAPTRELYIDDEWYSGMFNGSEFSIQLNNETCSVILNGPPPRFEISEHKRTDLVIGKVDLFIDERLVARLFLDGKPQLVKIYYTFLTFRFTNALKTVLINDVPFYVEFGGSSKFIFIRGKKHSIRFSSLPFGIQPGSIRIANMEEWIIDTSNIPFLSQHSFFYNKEQIDDTSNFQFNCNLFNSTLSPSELLVNNYYNNHVLEPVPQITNNTQTFSLNNYPNFNLQSINNEYQQRQSVFGWNNINNNGSVQKWVSNVIIPQSQCGNYENVMQINMSKYEGQHLMYMPFQKQDHATLYAPRVPFNTKCPNLIMNANQQYEKVTNTEIDNYINNNYY